MVNGLKLWAGDAANADGGVCDLQLPYVANMKKKIGMVIALPRIHPPPPYSVHFPNYQGAWLQSTPLDLCSKHRQVVCMQALFGIVQRNRLERKEVSCAGCFLRGQHACVLQIAGGSGLTPMLQVIKEIARNPQDTTEVTFVFANQSLEDIILKKELDEIAATHKNINVTTMEISL